MNQWLPNKSDRTMGYFTHNEVPFQFALANAFTLVTLIIVQPKQAQTQTE
ncbi:hypothetical protein CRG86_006425 [Photobacterium leiognathi]|nr:hypothetical protein CRG86_006425 [Photobacterium leiognathi]